MQILDREVFIPSHIDTKSVTFLPSSSTTMPEVQIVGDISD